MGGGTIIQAEQSREGMTGAAEFADYIVLNDLWRVRLSRRRLIHLLAYSLPPLPSVSSTDDTQED